MDNELYSPDCRVALRKTSLIDYPGLLSAVIFFPGCNLRCPWCHNRELVLGNYRHKDTIDLNEAMEHIKKRRKVLGGVVLSGGEPTLFKSLGPLITHIKLFGLKVKVDTNGILPDVLKSLFNTEETKPDYIAMDLKTSPSRYVELLPGKNASNPGSGKTDTAENPGETIKQSATLIRASGINHEFRSLVFPPATGNRSEDEKNVKSFFGEKDRAVLAEIAGNSTWNIRPFIPGNCIDPAWDNL